MRGDVNGGPDVSAQGGVLPGWEGVEPREPADVGPGGTGPDRRGAGELAAQKQASRAALTSTGFGVGDRRTPNARDGRQLAEQGGRDRCLGRGGCCGRRAVPVDADADDVAELLEQSLACHRPAVRGAAVGEDRGEHPDRGAGGEEGDDEPTDRPKRAARVVGQAAPGEQGGRTLCAPSHGPSADHGEPGAGDHQPGDDQEASREVGPDLPTGALRVADHDEVDELGDPRDQGRQTVRPGSRWGDAPGDPQRRDLRSSHGEARRDGGGGRDADRDHHDVDQPERQVAWREPLTGEGHVGQRRADSVEQAEADRHTPERGDGGLDRRDHADLSGGGAGQAHGGEALLTSGGRQAGGGADEDQHRQQQGERADREDRLELLGVKAASDPPDARIGVDAGDLRGARHLGELLCAAADDDDERARRGQSRAEGPIVPIW